MFGNFILNCHTATSPLSILKISYIILIVIINFITVFNQQLIINANIIMHACQSTVVP